MAMRIIKDMEASPVGIKCDRRLYLSAEGKVVEEGDRSAALLFAVPGNELSDADMEQHGLKFDGTRVILPNPAGPPPQGEKMSAPAENKAAAKGEDKGRKKRGVVEDNE